MSNVLATTEAQRLGELETTIERGLKTFYEVGSALLEIRDSRLYRAEYDTFEAYCRARWEMGRNYANRMIQSAEVIENLSQMVPIVTKPASESQARPLTKLPPEQQPEAWQKAVETAPDGKVTAKHVAAVVDEMTAPEQPEPEPDGIEAFCADCNATHGDWEGTLDAEDRRVWQCRRCEQRQATEGIDEERQCEDCVAFEGSELGDAHFYCAHHEMDWPLDENYAEVCTHFVPRGAEVEPEAAPEGEFEFVSLAPPARAEEDRSPGMLQDAAACVMGRVDREVSRLEDFDVAWEGNVLIAPPRGLAPGWTQRLRDAYASGLVEQAVMEVHVSVDSPWFFKLWEFPICFPDPRGELAELLQTDVSVLVYLGPAVARFIEVFGKFGSVALDATRETPASASQWDGDPIPF